MISMMDTRDRRDRSVRSLRNWAIWAVRASLSKRTAAVLRIDRGGCRVGVHGSRRVGW